MIFIYITCPNKKEAQKIGRALLEARLVACVNIFPVESAYWWQNKITKDKEVVLLLKTLKKNFKKIESLVQKIHSYQVPCLCALSIIKVNKEYFNWLKKEIK
jgi:periplasmic divalent cation tolerance protein